MMMTVFCTVLPWLSESVIAKQITHHLYQIPASKIFTFFFNMRRDHEVSELNSDVCL